MGVALTLSFPLSAEYDLCDLYILDTLITNTFFSKP
jgi:hypothetical protein